MKSGSYQSWGTAIAVGLVVFATPSCAKEERRFAITLPRASSGTLVKRVSEVTLAPGGALRLDGTPVTVAQLRARLRTLVRANPQQGLVLAADRSVPHGEVVKIMDLARVAGVRKFSVAVKPK